MAIETNIFTYEILVRLNKGEFQGAHVMDLIETVQNGRVIGTTISDPRNVTAKEVGKIIGDASATLIEQAQLAIEAQAVAEKFAASLSKRCDTLASNLQAAQERATQAEQSAINLYDQAAELRQRLDAAEQDMKADRPLKQPAM